MDKDKTQNIPIEQPDTQQPPIVDPEKLNRDLPDEYISKKIETEEGGVGSHYTIPINNYSVFKNAVNGHGYDIDNYYGWQCWDGAALLWQQLGLSLITGNGLAIGCWDLKRNVNKYTKFDLVTNINSLKLGDVVAMRPNHIGFFDGYDGAYMRILAQNQGGIKGPNGGMAFNIVRITKSAFAGAFRLKAWQPKPKKITPNTPVTIRINKGRWIVYTGAGKASKNFGSSRPALGGQKYGNSRIMTNGWAMITFLNRRAYIEPAAFKII